VQVGREPEAACVSPRPQTSFTDPDSRIMHTPDGFQHSYNAQLAVDAESQVIVAQEVSQAPPDVQRLRPMLSEVIKQSGRVLRELSADADYASEANFAALEAAGVYAVIALRRYRRDEPPDADPAAARSTNRWPHRNRMRERLFSPEGKQKYKLRKQTVEPVIGQIKAVRASASSSDAARRQSRRSGPWSSPPTTSSSSRELGPGPEAPLCCPIPDSRTRTRRKGGLQPSLPAGGAFR
jgi:Transposase DDE domain